jgi:hypothetical protein
MPLWDPHRWTHTHEHEGRTSGAQTLTIACLPSHIDDKRGEDKLFITYKCKNLNRLLSEKRSWILILEWEVVSDTTFDLKWIVTVRRMNRQQKTVFWLITDGHIIGYTYTGLIGVITQHVLAVLQDEDQWSCFPLNRQQKALFWLMTILYDIDYLHRPNHSHHSSRTSCTARWWPMELLSFSSMTDDLWFYETNWCPMADELSLVSGPCLTRNLE